MASSRATVKLPNCSPFQIRVEELVKLYAEIKTHGYLQLECLASSDATKIPNREQNTATHSNSLLHAGDGRKMGAILRSPEDVARNNATRYNNMGNSLKRQKNVFDYPEQDQNDIKHPKLARSSAPAPTQRPAGDYNMLDRLVFEAENSENSELPRSPRNTVTSRPNEIQPANPPSLEFESESLSPTAGIHINLKNTLDHIDEI